MANKAIMRLQKIKFDSISLIERHQERRDKLMHREHPDLEKNNFTVKQFQGESMRTTVKKAMQDQELRQGRRMRKDATVLVEFVLTFSPEMTDKIDLPKWIDANVKWLKNEYGASNLIRLDFNADEKTPHLHAFVMPLDEERCFRFKKKFDTIRDYVDSQTRYAKEMEPFGLTRGESRYEVLENGKLKAKKKIKRNTPLNAYKQSLLKQIEELQRTADEFDNKSEELNRLFKKLNDLAKTLNDKNIKLKETAERLETLKKEIFSLTNKKSQIEGEIAQATQEKKALMRINEHLQQEIEYRRSHLADEIWRDDNESSREFDPGKGRLIAGDDVLDL